MTAKYTLLIIAVAILFLIAFIRTTADYKTKKISKNKYIINMIMWLFIALAISFVHPMYDWLRMNGLTDSAPMSIFDTVLLTIVVFQFYILVRQSQSISDISNRVTKIHEMASIDRSLNRRS